MNLNESLPPENPVTCKNQSIYCCKTDFCNSDEITRQKFSKLHNSEMGKLIRAHVAVWYYLNLQILSLFDVLEKHNCIAISY